MKRTTYEEDYILKGLHMKRTTYEEDYILRARTTY